MELISLELQQIVLQSSVQSTLTGSSSPHACASAAAAAAAVCSFAPNPSTFIACYL
jgi:hypothetical protein